MLETLRTYGAGLLDQAGELPGAEAALARWALDVAGQAAAGLATGTAEVAAARRLDEEDAAMSQVLAWAMDHDAAMALRLAVALAPWWFLRGRLVGQYPLLRETAGRAAPGSDEWCDAQSWLGQTAVFSGDLAGALGHYTAVRDVIGDRGPAGRWWTAYPAGRWSCRTWGGLPRRPRKAAAPWPWPARLATRPGRRWP